jgi:hypothetical protein
MTNALEGDLIGRITKEKLELPPGYLEFVRSKIRMLFPHGIRRKSLMKEARRVTPPFTSTTTSRRCDGGSYNFWQGRREEFLNPAEITVKHTPVFSVATDAGKPRPLIKNDPSYLLLKPLHRLIYERISREKWLLRGEFSAQRIVKAGFSRGGLGHNLASRPFFSADFTAATDSLPIEVAETIIDALAQLSPSDISPLLSEARSSLRPLIAFSKRAITPTTGQMMGSLLSFPLLCLQNWLAACWVDEQCGEETPKLINGDDLLVEASGLWVRTYRRVAPSLGLNLNEKKTMYSARFMTMNSTYRTSAFKLIPFVRCRGLGCSDPRALAGAYNGIVGPWREAHSPFLRRLSHAVLTFFRRLVYASGRTLHGLGIRQTPRETVPQSLWNREKRKIGQCEKPLPEFPSNLHPELVQIVDDGRTQGAEIAEEMVREHWDMGPFPKEKLLEEKKRCSLAAVWSYLRETRLRRAPCRNSSLAVKLLRKRKEEKKVWVPRAIAERLARERTKEKEEEAAMEELWTGGATRLRVAELAQLFWRPPDLIL